jgi:hypothetical protein
MYCPYICPGRSEDNAQWIWLNPQADMRIVGRYLQNVTLPLPTVQPQTLSRNSCRIYPYA